MKTVMIPLPVVKINAIDKPETIHYSSDKLRELHVRDFYERGLDKPMKGVCVLFEGIDKNEKEAISREAEERGEKPKGKPFVMVKMAKDELLKLFTENIPEYHCL